METAKKMGLGFRAQPFQGFRVESLRDQGLVCACIYVCIRSYGQARGKQHGNWGLMGYTGFRVTCWRLVAAEWMDKKTDNTIHLGLKGSGH